MSKIRRRKAENVDKLMAKMKCSFVPVCMCLRVLEAVRSDYNTQGNKMGFSLCDIDYGDKNTSRRGRIWSLVDEG